MHRTGIFFRWVVAGVACLSLSAGCSRESSVCPAGKEGVNCTIDSRSRYIANWIARDRVNGHVFQYRCVVSRGKQPDQIWLSKSFAGYFFSHPVVARVTGRTVRIPFQKPDGVGSLYAISGNGRYIDGGLQWNYTIVADATGAQQVRSGEWTTD